MLQVYNTYLWQKLFSDWEWVEWAMRLWRNTAELWCVNRQSPLKNERIPCDREIERKVCAADEGREGEKWNDKKSRLRSPLIFSAHSPCLILNPTSIHSAAEFNSAAQWAIIIIYGCPRTAAGIYYWLTERALEWVRAWVRLHFFKEKMRRAAFAAARDADAVSISIKIRVCKKYCKIGKKPQHFHKN